MAAIILAALWRIATAAIISADKYATMSNASVAARSKKVFHQAPSVSSLLLFKLPKTPSCSYISAGIDRLKITAIITPGTMRMAIPEIMRMPVKKLTPNISPNDLKVNRRLLFKFTLLPSRMSKAHLAARPQPKFVKIQDERKVRERIGVKETK